MGDRRPPTGSPRRDCVSVCWSAARPTRRARSPARRARWRRISGTRVRASTASSICGVSPPWKRSWPADWPVTRADLDPSYDRVERVIGLQTYPLDRAPYDRTRKTVELREAANRRGLDWRLVPLAVTFAGPGRDPVPGEAIAERPNLHGQPRSTCRLVAECDLGCNFGSKNSLDYTFLSAAPKDKLTIRCRCEVRSFEPVDNGFSVSYVHHQQSAEGKKTDTRCLPLTTITAHCLVVSAGTFGTTYLLLRNRDAFPNLSPTLGSRFSGNGDFLSFVLRARSRAGGEQVPRILDPNFGPVITSAVRIPDYADGGRQRGLYVEDAGYPQFARWMIDDNAVALAARVLRFTLRRAWARFTRTAKSSVGSQLSSALSKACSPPPRSRSSAWAGTSPTAACSCGVRTSTWTGSCGPRSPTTAT